MIRYVIVEDEYYARMGLEHKVKATGRPFELVGAADNGDDALALIREKRPDCVLTDMQIPGTDGVELLKTLRRENIGAKVVIISGYSEFRYAQVGIEAGALGYVLKPFSVEELDETLSRVQAACEAESADAGRAGERLASVLTAAPPERAGLPLPDDKALRLLAARALPALLNADGEALNRLLTEERLYQRLEGRERGELCAAAWYLMELASRMGCAGEDLGDLWRDLSLFSDEGSADTDRLARRLLSALPQNRPVTAQEPTEVSVCRHVWEKSDEPLTLELVASRFHISPSHLSRLLSAEYGMPFNRLLNYARMRKARRLLRQTRLPVSAVASQCGFTGEKYFSQVFRRDNGLTPSEYRSGSGSEGGVSTL